MSVPSAAVKTLARAYLAERPGEAAQYLETLPSNDAGVLLGSVAPATATAVLRTVRPETAANAILTMGDDDVTALLAAADPARAAEWLTWTTDEDRAARLATLPPQVQREIEAVATYPRDTAGNLMDPRVLTFRPGATVADALARLRDHRDRRVASVYLVDDEGMLEGAVRVQDLAVADPAEALGDLRRPAVSIQATAPTEEVSDLLEHHRFTAVPVTDFHGRVIGVIRYDALLALAGDDARADLQAMVGVSREERALSSPLFAVRKRLPWLQVNLLTAFLAAFVVGLFESTIAQFTALAVLLPVVAGQSGNTGAQALAVTMRGLALREIRPRHWPPLALKELTAGILNGIAVATVTSVAVLVWSGSPGLAGVIGVSMVASMAIAGLAGASIPVLLSLVGQDPAQSSSIVLTTVTDVTGFLSFLGLATLASGLL